jgi:polyhydroxyalkanoate synthesis regulator phasin
MTDLATSNDSADEQGEGAPPPPPPPKRSPGHRGQDVRDTVAELAARAHEISLEAGSKMSGALRDVIGAAAGLTAFAVESARDLVQYMVRRGQMTQEEADKLIREAEEASARRPKPAAGKAEPARKPAAPAKTKAPSPRPKAEAAKANAKPKAAARKPSPGKTASRKPSARKK